MAYFEYVLFVNVLLQSFSTKIFPSAPLSKRTFHFCCVQITNISYIYRQLTFCKGTIYLSGSNNQPSDTVAFKNTVLYHVHIYASMHTVVGTFLEATMHDLIRSQKMLVTSPSH
jgi:hypothetical protein